MTHLSPEQIAASAAVVLSLLATYVPKFNTWHAALPEETKKLLWAAILLLVTAGAVGWSCSAEGTCQTLAWREYLTDYIGALLLAIGANQGTYLLSPKPSAVKEAALIGKLRKGTG